MTNPTDRNKARLKDQLEALISEMVERGILFREAVSQVEKQYILNVLKKHNGNLSKTADILHIHRNTLSKRISEYKIKI